YMDRIPAKWQGDSVTSAHEEGAYQATKHLIGLGHKRIATIAGPPTGTSAQARLKGFMRAMHEAKLRIPQDYIQHADFIKSAGHEKAVQLLCATPRPTAIFAANDLIAFGVLAAIREAGLRCPQDISLIGFDNLDDSDATVPALSTVDQFVYQLGARAAKTVIDRVRGDNGAARKIILQPELRLKESTAKPVQSSKSSTNKHR
ncbi:MAG: substrate-binding domain-containing protein, partial [Acidobacteria bacterium]|nr:substrate-binding domain-containing protein [Acidobacteriota bacterium]